VPEKQKINFSWPNRSQILQYVKHTTKINIAKEIAKFRENIYVFGQNVKAQQQNEKSNIKDNKIC